MRRWSPGLMPALIVLLVASTCHAESPYPWRNVALGGGGGYCTHLVIHPKDPNILYMGTDMGGAYRWDAPASRWIPVTDCFAEPTRYGVESIAVDPNDSNKVYMTLGQHLYNPLGGIYVSTDKGDTWKCGLKIRVDGGDGNYAKSSGERLAVDPNNTTVIYGQPQ